MTRGSRIGALFTIAALSGCGGGGGGFAPGALGASGGGSPVLPQPPVATPTPFIAHYPLTVSPAIVALDAPGDSASLTTNEVNYGGKLVTYVGGCSGIVTISPASEIANANGSATFEITANKSHASCRPIFEDTYGQSGSSLANVGSPATPAPTMKPTASPVPTMQPTATPVPVAPSASPVPTIKPTMAPTPLPTAVPTAKPTAMPTVAPNYGPLMVTPASFALGDVNPDSGSFTVSETKYAAPFGESDTCNGIATITPPAGGGSGPSAFYAVQDENAGTCVVTFTDNHGGSQARQIQVTTFGIIINAKKRGSN